MASQTPSAGSEYASNTGYDRSWQTLNSLLRDGFSWSGFERNCGFLNARSGTMVPASFVSGFEGLDDGRGLAVTDWDHDGDLDVWMSARTSPAVRFFENQSAPSAGIAVRLQDTQGARDAIGARLTLKTQDGRQMHRTLRAGDGFLSQSSKWVFFGIPEGQAPQSLVVRWPNRRATSTFEGLEPGGRYVLTEGASEAVALDLPARGPLSSQPLDLAPDSVQARIVSPSRIPFPKIPLEPFPGGERVPVPQEAGPTLVTLWASWCPNCQAELRDFAGNADRLAGAGVSIVAVSTDRLPSETGGSEAAARRFWARLDAPFPSYWATQSALDPLQVLHQTVALTHLTLPLPTGFLLDEQGRLAVIYRGPVTLETVLRDVGLMRRDGGAALTRSATPFLKDVPYERPKISPLTYARNLYEGGRPEAAIAYAVQLRSEDAFASIAGEAQYFEANILYQIGAIEESRDAYAAVLQREPRRFTAARNAARLSARLEEWERADEFYAAALQIAPEDLGLYLERSRAQVEMGDYDGARATARRALALAPRDAQAQDWLRQIDRIERQSP